MITDGQTEGQIELKTDFKLQKVKIKKTAAQTILTHDKFHILLA
jgi:hypothetical protein